MKSVYKKKINAHSRSPASPTFF